ncbi:unnamed protein product, partial [Ectocarpus sp. 12 AP-2014]
LLTSLGGIPVDRSSPQGLVGQMTDEFHRRSQLVLGITPEGTRGGVAKFKAGFARIAESAQVPVLPAVLNYEDRIVRFAGLIEDVSNVDETVQRVRLEYASGSVRQ